MGGSTTAYLRTAALPGRVGVSPLKTALTPVGHGRLPQARLAPVGAAYVRVNPAVVHAARPMAPAATWSPASRLSQLSRGPQLPLVQPYSGFHLLTRGVDHVVTPPVTNPRRAVKIAAAQVQRVGAQSAALTHIPVVGVRVPIAGQDFTARSVSAPSQALPLAESAVTAGSVVVPAAVADAAPQVQAPVAELVADGLVAGAEVEDLAVAAEAAGAQVARLQNSETVVTSVPASTQTSAATSLATESTARGVVNLATMAGSAEPANPWESLTESAGRLGEFRVSGLFRPALFADNELELPLPQPERFPGTPVRQPWIPGEPEIGEGIDSDVVVPTRHSPRKPSWHRLPGIVFPGPDRESYVNRPNSTSAPERTDVVGAPIYSTTSVAISDGDRAAQPLAADIGQVSVSWLRHALWNRHAPAVEAVGISPDAGSQGQGSQAGHEDEGFVLGQSAELDIDPALDGLEVADPLGYDRTLKRLLFDVLQGAGRIAMSDANPYAGINGRAMHHPSLNRDAEIALP